MSILGALPWRTDGRRVLDADGHEICEVYQTVHRPSVHDCMELAQAIAAMPALRDAERRNIAALVMQGLCAHHGSSALNDAPEIARRSVIFANSLVTALNAEPQP